MNQSIRRHTREEVPQWCFIPHLLLKHIVVFIRSANNVVPKLIVKPQGTRLEMFRSKVPTGYSVPLETDGHCTPRAIPRCFFGALHAEQLAAESSPAGRLLELVEFRRMVLRSPDRGGNSFGKCLILQFAPSNLQPSTSRSVPRNERHDHDQEDNAIDCPAILPRLVGKVWLRCLVLQFSGSGVMGAR